MLSENAKAAIREQMARYPDSRSALGHALYIAQEECGGWVPHEAVKDVAGVMDMEAADVQSMMSFYVMYNKEPVGKHVIEVCHNISCAVMGSGKMFEMIHEKCGIGPGETSADGLFTLKSVECSAACGGAPAVQINGMFYENKKPEEVAAVLDELKSKGQEGLGFVGSMYNLIEVPEKAAKPYSGGPNAAGKG